ncbi:Rapid ALkalinization Factor [Dillenia turbinata]|uniref:Rapid ALkalinization Factor n=1 Tax=Dillenia turbinata TaxID=194707 RepID=A0AAN8W0A0_9MAGN
MAAKTSGTYLSIVLSSLLVTSLILSSSPALTEASSDHQTRYSWMQPRAKSTCQGSIAECLSDGELMMDSETHRRILATTTNYISYDALKRDYVPCSQRGQSYYNCQPGAPVNPYTRGCSAITRCRS